MRRLDDMTPMEWLLSPDKFAYWEASKRSVRGAVDLANMAARVRDFVVHAIETQDEKLVPQLVAYLPPGANTIEPDSMARIFMAMRYSAEHADEDNTSLTQRLFFFDSWRQCGFPDFSLTHGLFGSLLLTGVDDVDRRLKYPFPCFSISFPENDLVPLRRVYVYEVMSLAGPSIGICFESKLVGPDGGDTFSFDIHQPVGTPIGEMFPVYADAFKPLMSKEQYDQMNTIVLNSLLYIETIPRREAPRAADSIVVSEDVVLDDHPNAKATRWSIGHTIKLPQAMLNAVRSGKTAWTLQSKFMVRGHWKTQRYGALRLQKRSIWIQPYWKGPEDIKEALQRKFEVDQS